MTVRVVVLGDLMVDVVVHPHGTPAPTSDTPSTVRISRGGSAANVAAALVAAHCDVEFAGVVGTDGLGEMAVSELQRDGVSLRVRSVSAPTGVVVAMVAPDGQRAMYTSRGANAFLDEQMAIELTSGEFDHLHLSGYTVLGEETRRVVAVVINDSIRRGRSISVDVCSLGPLLSMGPDKFLASVAGASTLFANEEEALALSHTTNVPDAMDYLARHFEEVMISQGPNGATAANANDRVSVSAHSGDVIDTTGAGDAASGSYLAARLQGETMSVALSRAMTAAAFVVRRLGASS